MNTPARILTFAGWEKFMLDHPGYLFMLPPEVISHMEKAARADLDNQLVLIEAFANHGDGE